MRIRLEQLLGRMVRDESGRAVGRIFEMRAEERNGAMEIVEFHLGAHAALERIGLTLSRIVAGPRDAKHKIPWDQLDLSDPERPVLRGAPESAGVKAEK
jgi:hypothetical protein